MFALVVKANAFFTFFLKLVCLNILWFLSTFLGLIFFSIGPATYALNFVLKKMISSPDSFPLFKTYWQAFKGHYKENVFLSWLYILIGHIIVIDLLFVDNLYLKILLFMIGFFYCLSLTFIFPVTMNYPLKGIFQRARAAFLVGLGSLHYSLVLYVLLVALNWLIFKTIPGLFLMVGISLNLVIILWFSRQIFAKIDLTTN